MRLNRRAVLIGLLLVVLGGGAVFAGMKLFAPATVLYQDPTDPGPDPFTDPAVLISDTQPETTTLGITPSVTTSSEPVVHGPFGGSGKIGDCDPELLIRFLNEHPDRKKAWAGVLGIEVNDVESYIRSARKVILSRDTRVTNHGFKNGKAYEIQSILAAGTAVLVDEKGEIVTRCYCGNPLTPPEQIEYKCDGCPPNYNPPPPCNQTCYPEETTTTTTPTTTTLVDQTTTTTRRKVTTTTTRPRVTTTTRPPQTATVGLLPTTTTSTEPPTTEGRTTPPQITSSTTTTRAPQTAVGLVQDMTTTKPAGTFN